MQVWEPTPAFMLTGLDSALALLRSSYAWEQKGREILFVAHTDGDGRCLHLARYPGEASDVEVPVQEILKDAIWFGSRRLVLAHNHPSGDPTPSASDIGATRRLAATAEALSCMVADHVIVTESECYSFRAHGLL